MDNKPVAENIEKDEKATHQFLLAICLTQQREAFNFVFKADDGARAFMDSMEKKGLIYIAPEPGTKDRYVVGLARLGKSYVVMHKLLQPYEGNISPFCFYTKQEFTIFLHNLSLAESQAKRIGLDDLKPLPEDMPKSSIVTWTAFNLRAAIYMLTHQRDRNGYGDGRKISLYVTKVADQCKARKYHAEYEAKVEKGEPELMRMKMKAKPVMPKDIKKFLDAHIIGQEAAKKQASVVLFSHMIGVKRNALFAGPSGCGKTEIFRQLKTIYPNIYIYDVSNITTSGFTGHKKADTVFSDLIQMGVPIERIEHSIIVFDEFDKLCAPSFNSKGENVSRENQGEFLSMIEGTDLSTSDGIIDTRNISFVFLGAFEDIFLKKKKENETHHIGFGANDAEKTDAYDITVEDLIEFGVRTEIAGRILSITRLNKLTADDYVRILKSETISPIEAVKKDYGIDLHIDDEEIRAMAEEASQKSLGARWLRSEVMQRCDEEIFEGHAIMKPMPKQEMTQA